MPIVSQRVVLRARRLMVVGLVVTVLGNRLIDGGFEALTAAGTIAVTTLVAVSSLSTVSVMAFPAYARWLKKFSPDTALITVDLLEALLSLVAIFVTLAAPQYATAAVVAYVLIDLFLAPVSDIAEEFYGAKLAEYGEDEALAFNSSLYALLGLLGLVVASPLGAVLSGLSTVVLLAANVILSLAGAAFRAYARSRAPMPPAIDADDEEFAMTGERLPWRQFVHDLLASGPASPLLSLALDLVGELTGRLLFLWVAARAAMEPHAAMGTVLAVCRVSPIPPLRWLGAVYVEIFRNMPMLSLLVLLVFGMPDAGLLLPLFWTGVLALVLSGSAFVCETIRSGINTVPVGHAEAARSIGLGFFGVLRHVVLPQAFRTMIQPLVNIFIGTVIGSSLCAAVAVPELTYRTQAINNQYAEAVIMFLTVGAVYLAIAFGGGAVGAVLDRRLSPARALRGRQGRTA